MNNFLFNSKLSLLRFIMMAAPSHACMAGAAGAQTCREPGGGTCRSEQGPGGLRPGRQSEPGDASPQVLGPVWYRGTGGERPRLACWSGGLVGWVWGTFFLILIIFT